jgi:2-polyprenyl-6-methoxyphenol hydroxylase-like FAD-dependent oxidoreductase
MVEWADPSGCDTALEEVVPAYDVLICGGGVGGLTLARALGRQQRRVLVVEKHRTARDVYRGELLQPRSLEILDALGALPAIVERGALRVPRLVCRGPAGAEIGALDYGTLSRPFDHCLVHYYRDIKGSLADGLGAGVEVRLGARAEELRRDPSGRVAGAWIGADGQRFEVDATLVVGCDGYASRLRDAAGIAVPMGRYDHQLAAFDLADAPPLGSDVAAYLTRQGLRLLFAMPGRRARLYAQVRRGEFRGTGRAGLAAWAERLLGSVPALAPLAASLLASLDSAQVLSAWRFTAPEWTRPGFALLGDAAHCVHPMAGQGMNAAIADAWALARQLAEPAVLTPGAVDQALLRYEELRRPQLAYISRLSHNLAGLFTATSWSTRTAGAYMLRRNRSNRRLQHILAYNMSGLGVQRFTTLDRLCQFGLPDPRGARR